MSACGGAPLLDLPEQLCYVHCGFCTTILLVSVPRTSLSKVVTVRCGHCQGLLAVDMRSVPLVPLQLLSSIGVEECPVQQKRVEHASDCPMIRATDGLNAPLPSAGYGENKEAAAGEDQEEEEEDDDDHIADAPMNTTVNKPPEKRQRAPSAYNRFIKEEIKRIKGREPGITHKEAFSAAAKNWAHFPRIQQKGTDGECCSMMARDGAGAEKDVEGESQDIHKKKIQRRSAKTMAFLARRSLRGQEKLAAQHDLAKGKLIHLITRKLLSIVVGVCRSPA